MAIRAWRLTPKGLSPIPEPESVPALLAEGASLWLDLAVEDVPALGPARLGLPGHPLNWEDAQRRDHRPKLEDYGDHLFLVVRCLDTREDWLARQLQTLQLACFLGPRLLVTVRGGDLGYVDQVSERMARGLMGASWGPDGVLHGLLDRMVDALTPHLERWETEVERLDKEALRNPRTPVLGRILAIRKHMVKLRRLAAGHAEILEVLSRTREELVRAQARPYFRDVHDHLLTVLDGADSLRDSVTIAVDIYLNSVNNRLNEIMKVLTGVSLVLLPLSLVTGIFGMNFAVMPGLHHPSGFWWTLGGMGVLSLALLWLFRRFRLF
jgi:magnesium transporter